MYNCFTFLCRPQFSILIFGQYHKVPVYIVHYLGTHCDPESMVGGAPTVFEQSHKSLFPTTYSVCTITQPTRMASFISSNNVLLITGRRAKVTDFGMVKLYNMNTVHAASETHHIVAINNQVCKIIIVHTLHYSNHYVIIPN